MNDEETQPLTREEIPSRSSQDDSNKSVSSVSTTSLVLEHINDNAFSSGPQKKYRVDHRKGAQQEEDFDAEDGQFQGTKSVDKKARRFLWILGIICADRKSVV